jgi:hypothetical protein
VDTLRYSDCREAEGVVDKLRYSDCRQAEGVVDTPLLGRGRPGTVPPFHLQEAARPWNLLPLTFR